MRLVFDGNRSGPSARGRNHSELPEPAIDTSSAPGSTCSRSPRHRDNAFSTNAVVDLKHSERTSFQDAGAFANAGAIVRRYCTTPWSDTDRTVSQMATLRLATAGRTRCSMVGFAPPLDSTLAARIDALAMSPCALKL